MIIPVRCFSCGKPVSHYWEQFKDRAQKEDPAKVLDSMGFNRYCCRSVFIGTVDMIKVVGQFSK